MQDWSDFHWFMVHKGGSMVHKGGLWQPVEQWFASIIPSCHIFISLDCSRSHILIRLLKLICRPSPTPALTITSFLNGAVRLASLVEATMSSVQRVQEYSVYQHIVTPYKHGGILMHYAVVSTLGCWFALISIHFRACLRFDVVSSPI